jgi:hypothetical protein
MLVCAEANVFLALNAAISNEFTGGACLQFYFVDFGDAARSAIVSHLICAHFDANIRP